MANEIFKHAKLNKGNLDKLNSLALSWPSIVKPARTAGFTAQVGDYYIMDPTAGAFEMVCPDNPEVGDVFGFLVIGDGLNSVNVNSNGEKIDGGTGTFPYGQGSNSIYMYTGPALGWQGVATA